MTGRDFQRGEPVGRPAALRGALAGVAVCGGEQGVRLVELVARVEDRP